jgi:hypothetical protein
MIAVRAQVLCEAFGLFTNHFQVWRPFLTKIKQSFEARSGVA